MFSIIQLYIKKANFTLNIIFEYLEIFALFVFKLFFTFIILLNNVSRETFIILQIYSHLAIRTLDEGWGLDFGYYSRMLRIPKYSAWTYWLLPVASQVRPWLNASG